MASKPEHPTRDAAGVGPYGRDLDELVPISQLNGWKVKKGDADIRGWEVRTVSGRQLGVVKDLLIDREAQEVVLIDVDLPGTDRRTSVPVRVVEIDRTRRAVLMDSADFAPEHPPERVSGGEAAPVQPEPEAEPPRKRTSNVDPRLAETVRMDASSVGERRELDDRRIEDRRRIDRMGTDL